MDETPDKIQQRLRYQITGCLARREHSQFELRNKFLKDDIAPDLVLDVLAEFAQQGLQSDERFAHNLVKSRASRGYGLGRVKMELKQHQLERELQQTAIESSEVDWFDLARQVHDKKYGECLPKDFKDKQKRQRYLLYRGFDYDQVAYAISGGQD